jgi:NADH:ubiquinone oxidoreductase subunit D
VNRVLFTRWKPLTMKEKIKNIKTFNLNLGPQHPAAHGVLRLIVQLNGEVIEKIDPHIGLLHRGSEKLIEDKKYLCSIPYFDRFDYCSMLMQEHAYCLGIESLMGTTNYSSTFTQIRVLFDELTRLLNHFLAVSCHALDVGSMSPLFWAFEEREKIMEFYERASGARMHTSFYKPNELCLNNMSQYFLEDIVVFSRNCLTTLNEMHNILTYNKVWKQRLINVGTYSYKTAIDYSLTGVMARCTGIKRDLRLDFYETYANYYYLNFRGYIGKNGDSYDRFLIRMCEMTESLFIINQVLNKLLKFKNTKNIFETNKLMSKTQKFVNTNFLKNEYTTMESIIQHFKYWGDGFFIKSGWTYRAVESAKGEFGVSMVSDNSSKPFRCKVRSPAFFHLQILNKIAKGHFLSDLVTLLGTVDIVFGEIDR